MRPQPFGQSGGINSFDRLLAGGIDGRHEHHVGVVEGVLELVHQRLQPGIAVRLHDRDDPLLRAFACRGEDRANLGRVVGIIVDDHRTVGFAHLGEAALDSFEPFKPGNNCLI